MKIIIKSFLVIICFSFFMFKAHSVVFIVNEKNPVSNLSKQQILNFYFKKVRQWPDGNEVRFFDRSDESPERNIFLKDILNKTSRDLEEFWIGQKLYTGNSAPSQLSSDKMVKHMVMHFPGAIGYVRADFPITEGIKKIEITGNN